MTKEEVRKKLLQARYAIPQKRRDEASAAAADLHPEGKYILSYSAFRGELDLSLLNQKLAEEGRLALPRVEAGELSFYLVGDLSRELRESSWGILEPTPSLCPPCPPEQLSLVLVPAIAFDKQRHRIGYGKGFYDRLLASLPLLPSIGVGFTEQLQESLPVEQFDQKLNKLLLF